MGFPRFLFRVLDRGRCCKEYAVLGEVGFLTDAISIRFSIEGQVLSLALCWVTPAAPLIVRRGFVGGSSYADLGNHVSSEGDGDLYALSCRRRTSSRLPSFCSSGKELN